jgi:hydroxymethylbilane synthase
LLRLACRRSALARAQAHQVGQLIAERTGSEFELVPLATTGDQQPDKAVAAFDTKGLFVDTVRQAVLDTDADMVVHSYKDLPSEEVPGLVIAAVPVRADPRDLLVSRDGYALANLPATATVGTSSERRRLQLLNVKPGLQVLAVRGNLDTRLRKVAEGELDAIVIAAAGMQRLYSPPEQGGVGAFTLPLKAYLLEPGECLPAPAQGALAVECRVDDDDSRSACEAVHDPRSHVQVTAERAFAATLGGGCLAAIGALGTLIGGGQLELIGMLGDPGRRRVVRLSSRGPDREPERLGAELARDVAAALGTET